MPREIYVNIPDENPRTAPSFEVNVWPLSRRLLDTTSQGLLTQERRIQDYLHAYRLTGKPPVPSPQQPTDRAQRAALGLPPFMEPYTEVVHFNTDIPMDHYGGPSSTLVANGVPPGPIRDVQIFRPEPVTGEVRGAMFHCIVCQPEFRAWSVEELRADAYAKGRKYAPEAFSRPPPGPSQPTMNGLTPENFQSLTCKPDYMRHSFEELRLAFYRGRRQLTSAEIERNATLRIAAP